MCLGVPHQVVALIDEERCLIRLGSGVQPCFAGLVDELKPGDWVVVHAGFALDKISADDAAANLRLIEAYLQEEADDQPR
jgi:hydrogenase expression/formation protein HypC